MIYCHNCGRENREKSNYCPVCGTSLSIAESARVENSQPKLNKNGKNKVLWSAAVIVLVLVFFTMNGGISERRAVKVAKNYFKEECLELGCTVLNFSDVDIQLTQREDRALQQNGRYRVDGYVDLKNLADGNMEYYYFGMNVEFSNGVYVMAGSPTVETNYDGGK